MPYVDPGAVTTGTTITSTWGNAVRNAEQYLANPPACKMAGSGTQNVNTATRTAITFSTEVFDTDTMHDTSTNTARITIKTAGVYVVTGTLEFPANAGGSVRQVEIRLNGADASLQAINSAFPGSVGVVLSVSVVGKYAVNDYLELTAYQTSGATLACGGTAPYQKSFAATWVGLG